MGSVVVKAAFFPPVPLADNPEHFKDIFFLQNSFGNQFPVLNITRKGAKKTFLYSHGNAEDITHSIDNLSSVSSVLNVNVVAYEYPGYSYAVSDANGSPVLPSEAGCYDHGRLTYQWLVQQQGIDPADIIIYGRSLGSGPATHLAYTQRTGGLILQSPIMSAIRVVARQLFTMPFDIFPNCDKIPSINCPLLIIHGDQDNVVPFSHGQRLFGLSKSARKRNCWIAGAGHNDIELLYWNTYVQAIKGFLHDVEETPADQQEQTPQRKRGWFSSSSSSSIS